MVVTAMKNIGDDHPSMGTLTIPGGGYNDQQYQ